MRRIGCGRGLGRRGGAVGRAVTVGEVGGSFGTGLWRKISLEGTMWSECIKWKLGRGNSIFENLYCCTRERDHGGGGVQSR